MHTYNLSQTHPNDENINALTCFILDLTRPARRARPSCFYLRRVQKKKEMF